MILRCTVAGCQQRVSHQVQRGPERYGWPGLSLVVPRGPEADLRQLLLHLTDLWRFWFASIFQPCAFYFSNKFWATVLKRQALVLCVAFLTRTRRQVPSEIFHQAKAAKRSWSNMHEESRPSTEEPLKFGSPVESGPLPLLLFFPFSLHFTFTFFLQG